MEAKGYKPCPNDPATYVKWEGKEFLIVPTHVDDLFPTGNSRRMYDELWEHLSSKMSMKDLGEVKEAMGIKIEWDHKNHSVN